MCPHQPFACAWLPTGKWTCNLLPYTTAQTLPLPPPLRQYANLRLDWKPHLWNPSSAWDPDHPPPGCNWICTQATNHQYPLNSLHYAWVRHAETCITQQQQAMHDTWNEHQTRTMKQKHQKQGRTTGQHKHEMTQNYEQACKVSREMNTRNPMIRSLSPVVACAPRPDR